jgi:hypothetical protein
MGPSLLIEATTCILQAKSSAFTDDLQSAAVGSVPTRNGSSSVWVVRSCITSRTISRARGFSKYGSIPLAVYVQYAFIDPRGILGRNWQMNGARSKPPYTGILQIPVEGRQWIQTHENFVSSLTTKKNYNFDSTPFHRLLPRWKSPSETHGK